MVLPVRPPASIANRHGTAKPRSFSRPARTPPSYGIILLLSLHRIAMLTRSTCKTRGAVTSPGALLSAHRQLEDGGGGIYWPEHAARQAFTRNQDFAKPPATDYGWMYCRVRRHGNREHDSSYSTGLPPAPTPECAMNNEARKRMWEYRVEEVMFGGSSGTWLHGVMHHGGTAEGTVR